MVAAQRLKPPESLAQVPVGVDFFVPASRLGMHHAIDAVPHYIGVGRLRSLILHIRWRLERFLNLAPVVRLCHR